MSKSNTNWTQWLAEKESVNTKRMETKLSKQGRSPYLRLEQGENKITLLPVIPSPKTSNWGKEQEVFKERSWWRQWGTCLVLIGVTALITIIVLIRPLLGSYLPLATITKTENDVKTPLATSTPDLGYDATVVILASEGWHNTGINIDRGDKIEILDVTGNWRSSSGHPWGGGTPGYRVQACHRGPLRPQI